MAIVADWGNYEETLMILKFEGRWTAKEFLEATEKTNQAIRAKPHTVNIICDLRRTGLHAPPNLLSLAKGTLRDAAPNYGNIVVLSQSRFWRMLVEVLQGTGVADMSHFHFTADVTEAYQMAENGTASATTTQ